MRCFVGVYWVDVPESNYKVRVRKNWNIPCAFSWRVAKKQCLKRKVYTKLCLFGVKKRNPGICTKPFVGCPSHVVEEAFGLALLAMDFATVLEGHGHGPHLNDVEIGFTSNSRPRGDTKARWHAVCWAFCACGFDGFVIFRHCIAEKGTALRICFLSKWVLTVLLFLHFPDSKGNHQIRMTKRCHVFFFSLGMFLHVFTTSANNMSILRQYCSKRLRIGCEPNTMYPVCRRD